MKSKKPLLITIFIVYCAAVAYVTLARSASAVFDTFGMLGTDGVKVGSVALSPRGDWRMPSDCSAEVFLKDLRRVKP